MLQGNIPGDRLFIHSVILFPLEENHRPFFDHAK